MKTIIALGALALAGATLTAHAQTWPAKPVRWVLSQSAGSAPDIVARLVAERISRNVGQQFVVENRPGGGNAIGAQAVARSPADGYTFFFATAAALVTNPFVFKSLPYDPAKDFVSVGMIGRGPFFVTVNRDVPAANLAEFIALAKNAPGRLSFASDGPKGFAGLMGEWLNRAAGMKVTQVPYNVTVQGLQDTIAGRTQMTIQAIPVALPFAKRGEVKLLAVSSRARLPGLEDVPTVGETLPGFEVVGWFALVAPTGTPAEILQRMSRETDRVLKEPEVNGRLRDFGIYSDGAETPAAVDAFVAAERDRWGKLIREIGIEPE